MLTNRPPFVEYSDTFSWRQIQNIIMNVFEFPILLVIVAGFLPLFDSKSSKCEVCESMVNKFLDRLKAKSVGTDKLAQKEEFVEFCSNKYDREYKFCDNLGAYPNSPTSILNSFIDQVQLGLPADRICTKLQKLDSQICDLSYEKEYDLKTLDLKKLKVKDLKKILSKFNADCDGCIEKSDYVTRIEELKKAHEEL